MNNKCVRCNGVGYLKAPRPSSNPTCLECHGTGLAKILPSPNIKCGFYGCIKDVGHFGSHEDKQGLKIN